MAGILEKMLAADVIVMATPLYFYNMNAQMKTLIDRVYPVSPVDGTARLLLVVYDSASGIR